MNERMMKSQGSVISAQIFIVVYENGRKTTYSPKMSQELNAEIIINFLESNKRGEWLIGKESVK